LQEKSAWLIWLALLSSGRVDNLGIVTGKRFAGRARLLGESGEAKIVRKDRPSTLSLPITVVDQFSFEMVFNPFERGNITTFPDKGNAFQVA
jgi:hypothetical protein